MEQIFHIYNRGVDKRNVFLDENDYRRFIHDLFEFNDVKNVMNVGYFFHQSIDVERPYIEQREQDPLVEIICFVLMPNHFHLLLRPVKDDGISLFMKKLGGYTKYFNEKYDRSGALFQGRYKKVLVENSNHFEYLGFYIHCNPLDLKFPEWREGKLRNAEEAMRYLKNYKWSSLPDYLGEKNFPLVTQREFLQHREGPEGYKKQLRGWLGDLERSESFLKNKDLNLE